MGNEARKQCGRRLLAARESLGLTQGALGKLVGVDQVTVSRWENGHRVPSFESRLLLVEALGKDPYAIEIPTNEAVA
jgi:transcriptional regulator with XRE-family HTH domain